MSEDGTVRVPGHTLDFEGAPHSDSGYPVMLQGKGGEGRAKCSCGVMSEVLPSAAARKRWHRHHKLAVETVDHRDAEVSS